MDYARELADLEAQGLLRTLRISEGLGGKFRAEGGEWLNFSSNDYLDLAGDDRLKAAAKRAIDELGCGATASRLMSGHLPMHQELERRLAALAGRDAALIFGSGFLANLGVLTALAGRGDVIFADRLNHASLIDGARLSGARLVRYRHCDAGHLEGLLKSAGVGRALPAATHSHHNGGQCPPYAGDQAAGGASGRRIIVTDSVFSMDGDFAPLADLHELAQRFGCVLVVDEAHAIGVLGQGGGLCRQLGLAGRADAVIGTLSKSLGGYGGFVACSSGLRELLVNRARSFIYSTALPPACLGSALAALGVLGQSPRLGDELLSRAAAFRADLAARGLVVGPSACQIVPVMAGENDKALAMAERLRERRILATAIRPPTVPAGTARIRLSVTLAHSAEDLAAAAGAIADAARKTGVIA